MKTKHLIIFIILISLNSFTSKSQIISDSLRNSIQYNLIKEIKSNAKNPKYLDSLAESIYNNLARNYPNLSYEISVYYYNLAKNNNSDRLLAWAYLFDANNLMFKDSLKYSISKIESALRIFIKDKDYENIGNCYRQIATCYIFEMNINNAIIYYQKAIRVFETNNIEQKLFNPYYNLGNLFLKKNPEEAIKYFEKAITIMSRHKIETPKTNVFLNLASAYEKLRNYPKIKEYLDSARKYYDNEKSKYTENMINFYTGVLDSENKNYQSAILNFKKIIDNSEYLDLNFRLSILNNIGNNYFILKEYKNALIYFIKSDSIAKNRDVDKNIIKTTYKGLADSYEKLNMFQNAFNYSKLYNQIAMADLSNEKNLEIQKIIYNNEAVKKEFEIKKKEFQSQIEDNIYKKILIWVAILAIVILVLLVIYFYKVYTKNLLLSNKIRLENILNKKISQELSKSKQLLEESNNFKSSIMRNMSHEIITPFNGLLGYISILKRKINEYKDDDLIECTYNIEHSSKRILELITNLNDIALLESNDYIIKKQATHLPDLIQDVYYPYFNLAKTKNIQLNISKIEDIIIVTDPNALYKAIKNIFDNSIKFTDNGIVSISTLYKNNILEILIEDTGIGISEMNINSIGIPFKQINMNINRPFEGIGLGLAVTKQLVEKLDGEFKIESKINQGTKVIFRFENIEIQKDI